MATDSNRQSETTEKSGPQRSALESFFDSFLQESNIKWILMIGMAIVAGCSLMLVTQKWSGWPITLKYLTILGYTSATYAIAELCEKRLGLRSTSQVLKLLTIILIPIGFLALATLTQDTASIDVSGSLYTLLMMVPATAFMAFAADRIFKHWLQGRQITFLAAYMLMCLAGALPVVNQTWLAILFSCGFWLVMTLGVLKVNRHIFWLTEEHRWPRVYGFTPIAILGTQLIALYVTKTIGDVPMHWLGLGLVMVAATILMTTRTIASVFRQRTGDLVRPLPMALIAPLFAGLLLIASGVLLSFHGFHFIGTTTVAIVPTAFVAAGLLLMIAKDTRHQSFVWAGLILITIGYQSSPILFADLVQTLKSTVAASINEERLPVAFYGLTYMPLLLTFAVASRILSNRNFHEFSFPLKRYTTCLSLVLVAIALTNIKAAFIVTAISVVAFTLYAILFRERAYLAATVTSLILAAATLVPFLNAMQWADCDIRWTLVPLALLGLALSASRTFDRIAAKLPSDFDNALGLDASGGKQRFWIRDMGRAVTLVISVAWLAVNFTSNFVIATELPELSALAQWTAFALTALSLGVWTAQSKHYACGFWTWCVVASGGWMWLFSTGLAYTNVFAYVGIVTGVIGIATYAILQYHKVDISIGRFMRLDTNKNFLLQNRLSAILLPLADVAIIQFVFLVCVYYLPLLLWATATLNIAMVPSGWWLMLGLTVAAAAVFRGPVVTIGNVLIAPVAAGIAVGQFFPAFFTYENLPLVYAITSSAILAILFRRVNSNDRNLISACSLWLYGLLMLGFINLAPLTMVGSMIALSTICWIGRANFTTRENGILAAIASSLAIVSLAMLSGFQGFPFALVVSPLGSASVAWMTLGVVAAVLFFDHQWPALDRAITTQWSFALRLIGVTGFVVCFFANDLPSWLETAVVVSLVIAAINEFRAAIRTQTEAHVLSGFALIGSVALWIQLHHNLPISPTMLRVALVISAAVSVSLAKLWSEHAKLGIMVRSLRLYGLIVPMIVAGTSLLFSNHGAFETLAVFGSAMILFIYGLKYQMRRYVVAAAVIVNLGMFAVWKSVSISDPQFYLVPVGLTMIGLVELLRRDIHVKAHDPLRYAGALLILVSPCFAILGGSWLHMISLMILSVIVILIAIGLRLRALIHTGTAFLLIDLVAMVVRSSIDNPGMLWVTGLLVGAAVIALAAVCERNREQLLSRIRMLSSELATWH